MLGTIVHYAIDLALVSALLAGIRRTSGLTIKAATNHPNGDESYLIKYLKFGEKSFDFIIGVMTTFPNYFVRTPPPNSRD
ncbi:hypothetical protein AYI68_g2314 [Smittium mucronatum]|uniref:DUF1748-domain-containing protein n=1 Tax=Smittium mucronatum TaxID=133383 RepID=A0A1R0H336_9FUNG|nr:hypothetical protein AYI68_g2314 [Smittium mucronatum]